MSGISARQAVEAFRAWMAGTPCADQAHAEDRFIPVLNVSEFRNIEADRRFYVLIVEGPGQVRGSTCSDYVVVELTARWLDAWDSQGRMIDDLDAMRRRIKTFAKSGNYIYTTQVVAEARPDYVTLATSAVATFRVRIEYHRNMP
jgi:hypothetical protein